MTAVRMPTSWFESTAKANFEKFLGREAGKPDLTFLQIGAFKGEASVWLMENILTHPTSVLVDVDPWSAVSLDELSGFDMDEVEDCYEKAVKPYGPRVKTFKGTSNEFFRFNGREFDFIYIDGDHRAVHVLEDAVHAYRALKPWGYLAFDDYLYGQAEPKLQTPAIAIDTVKVLYDRRLDLIGIGTQAWFCKRAET